MKQRRAWIVTAISMAMMIFPCNCFPVDNSYTVGDSHQWDLGVDYATWASGKTFRAGDKLAFKYTVGMHNVLEVSKSAYDSCDATNPTKTYTGGSNTITFGGGGAKYFICGIPGHCSAGMKLAISVAAASTPSVSPSSNRSAPVPSPSPARSRSGTPSPTPSTPDVGSPSPASSPSLSTAPASTPSPTPTPSTPDVGSPSPAGSPSVSSAPASASTPSAAANGESASVNGTKISAATSSFPMDGVVVLVASLLLGHALAYRTFSLI